LFDIVYQWTSFAAITRPAITRHLTTTTQPAAALEAVRDQLGSGLRHKIEEEPDHRLLAYRPLAQISPLGITLGGLVIIGGWLLTQSAGWEATQLRLTENMPVTIPYGNQILDLKTFEVRWGNNDVPTTALGELSVEDDGVVAASVIDLSTDWRWRGTTYRLVAAGPAVQVEGKGADEKPLLLQTAANHPPTEEVTLLLPLEGGPRSFAAPDEGVVVQMETEPDSNSPLVHLRIYQGREGDLVEDRVISAETTIVLNGTRLTFRVHPYAQIDASYTPGRSLIVAGSIIILLGILSSLAFQNRQLEVTAVARKKRTELTFTTGRHDDSSWLKGLADSLETRETGDNLDGG
jgi:hypothetical protein